MLDISSFKKALLIAITFILLGWTLDSVIMSQVLHSGTFYEQFFQPNAHHLWMRTPPVVLTIVLVFSIRYFVIRQKQTIARLNEAIANVKTISGLIPICAWCKKIRNDKGYWSEVEQYIGQHSKAQFTHGMCPECLEKYFKEEALS